MSSCPAALATSTAAASCEPSPLKPPGKKTGSIPVTRAVVA